jgi:hypothetical protein
MEVMTEDESLEELMSVLLEDAQGDRQRAGSQGGESRGVVRTCSVDDRSVDLPERTTEAVCSPAPETTLEMVKACSCTSCEYRSEKPKIPCRDGHLCTKGDCKYVHACKPWTPSAPMPVGAGKACKRGIACAYLKCKFAHPSPSLECLECCAQLSNGGPHHFSSNASPTPVERFCSHNMRCKNCMYRTEIPGIDCKFKLK